MFRLADIVGGFEELATHPVTEKGIASGRKDAISFPRLAQAEGLRRDRVNSRRAAIYI